MATAPSQTAVKALTERLYECTTYLLQLAPGGFSPLNWHKFMRLEFC